MFALSEELFHSGRSALRTALISALKRKRDGRLYAEEAVAGRSLLDWQVDVALRLGCERVVCLCEAPSQAVIAQQRRVEGAGLAFHTARGPLQLASLFRDEDMVLLLRDALFVGGDTACDLLAEEGQLEPAIWTLPASHALTTAFPEDFERIDRERHWAGVAVIPGQCARALGDLPSDGDAVSLLLRLALQHRTECKAVPVQILESDDWVTASDQSALERLGAGMMATSLPDPQWAGPTNALATTIVRRSAPYWLQSTPEMSGLGALSFGVMGAGFAAVGYPVPGLAVVALGAFAAALSANARQMRMALGGEKAGAAWQTGLPLAMLLLATLTLVVANSQESDWLIRASLPVFAMGLAWIAGEDRVAKISAFWRDLPLHMAFSALAAGLGYLQEGMIAFALAALLHLVVRTTKQ